MRDIKVNTVDLMRALREKGIESDSLWLDIALNRMITSNFITVEKLREVLHKAVDYCVIHKDRELTDVLRKSHSLYKFNFQEIDKERKKYEDLTHTAPMETIHILEGVNVEREQDNNGETNS